MSKTISVLFLGVVVAGTSIVVGGCQSDNVDSVTTASTGTSSSSSSGEAGAGGTGGAGGAAGAGGMMSAGGNGGMGGGLAGAGGMGGRASTCMKAGNACADCLYDQCQNAYCDCAEEPACFAIIGCLQACPPMMPDCPGGCFATHSKGYAEFTITSSCAATLCAPSCPNTDQVKPCDLCLAQKCEMELETCLSNIQCFQLISCRDACMGMMGCENQCNMMYPQGVPLVQSLFTCAAMGCTGICN